MTAPKVDHAKGRCPGPRGAVPSGTSEGTAGRVTAQLVGLFGFEQGHGVAVASLNQSGLPASGSTRMRQARKLVFPNATRMMRLASALVVSVAPLKA